MSIFISYRRTGGFEAAEAIYNELRDDYEIFFDMKSLDGGLYTPEIENKIRDCSDFILIIHEGVFDKCSDSDDWILKESLAALEDENKRIIPVLIDGRTHKEAAPQEIAKIFKYQAIHWTDEDFFEKLEDRFLISNKMCRLSAVKKDDHLELTDSSRENLKELYRRFFKNGRISTDISLQIEDEDDASALVIKEDIIKQYGAENALDVAKKDMKDYIHKRLSVIERGIEFMLMDDMLDGLAQDIYDDFNEKYGLKNCFFTDEDGREGFYWTPYLWAEIIKGMLEELWIGQGMGRVNYYNNRDGYKQIKGHKKETDELLIVSHVKEDLKDPMYDVFIRKLIANDQVRYPFIPKHSLAYIIYPDFYYYLGRLKSGLVYYNEGEEVSFENISKINGVFNLFNYIFKPGTRFKFELLSGNQ